MKGTLKFLKDLPLYKEEQPYELYGFPESTSSRITNCEFEELSDIDIEDVRGREGDFTIENCGFQFFNAPSSIPLIPENFETPGAHEDVIIAYLKETMGIVEKKLGSPRTICFDWRVSSGRIGDISALID